MRGILLAAATAALSVVVLGAASPAGAFQSDDCLANFPTEPQQAAYACNVTVSQSFQDMEAPGACVPEPILFSGTLGGHSHITAKFAEGNLFITLDQHVFVDATGIGELTGTKYGLHEVGNGTSTQRFDHGANVFQQTIEGHENAQGTLPDLVIHAEMHQTIDGTGRYHLSIEHVTFGCRTHGT
ncbi:MAG: hypothetical protein WAQ33_00940 [Gaiellaceae bacterium]